MVMFKVEVEVEVGLTRLCQDESSKLRNEKHKQQEFSNYDGNSRGKIYPRMSYELDSATCFLR